MPDHFDQARWSSLTLFEQMGNIGSEVGRTMNALRAHDASSAIGASHRALDLIDATAAVWTSPTRRRELRRARDLFTSAITAETPDPSLERYFMEFAIAARAGR